MTVAIYVRVSTQRQAQAQTIEQQLDRLCAHLRNQGVKLASEGIFRDDGYSGATLNRPGLVLAQRGSCASMRPGRITSSSAIHAASCTISRVNLH